MSWIHIEDVARAFAFALERESLDGPINLAAPNPVTNAEFTKAMGRVLSRPTLFKVPGLALRIAMGEMAQFALGSARLYPLKLTQSGFNYRWNDIEPGIARHPGQVTSDLPRIHRSPSTLNTNRCTDCAPASAKVRESLIMSG